MTEIIPDPRMKKMPVMIHSSKVKAAVVRGKRPLTAVQPATRAKMMSKPNRTAITMGLQGFHPTLVLCSYLFCIFSIFCSKIRC